MCMHTTAPKYKKGNVKEFNVQITYNNVMF